MTSKGKPNPSKLSSRMFTGNDIWQDARAHLKKQNYLEAQNHYKRLLDRDGKNSDPADGNVLRVIIELAMVYKQQKQYPEAERILANALSKARTALDDREHQKLAGLRRLLGFMYLVQRQWHLAIVHLRFVEYVVLKELRKEVSTSRVEGSYLSPLHGQFVDVRADELSLCDVLLSVRHELACAEFDLKNYTTAEKHLENVLHSEYRVASQLSSDFFHQVNAWLGHTLLMQGRYSEGSTYLDLAQEHILTLYNIDGTACGDIAFLVGYAAYEQNQFTIAEKQFAKTASTAEAELSSIARSEISKRYSSTTDTYNARSWLELALWQQQKYAQAEFQLHRMLELSDDLDQYAAQYDEGKLVQASYRYNVWFRLGRIALTQDRFLEAATMSSHAISVFEAAYGTDHPGAQEARDLFEKSKIAHKEPEAPATQAELLSKDVDLHGMDDRVNLTSFPMTSAPFRDGKNLSEPSSLESFIDESAKVNLINSTLRHSSSKNQDVSKDLKPLLQASNQLSAPSGTGGIMPPHPEEIQPLPQSIVIQNSYKKEVQKKTPSLGELEIEDTARPQTEMFTESIVPTKADGLWDSASDTQRQNVKPRSPLMQSQTRGIAISKEQQHSSHLTVDHEGTSSELSANEMPPEMQMKTTITDLQRLEISPQGVQTSIDDQSIAAMFDERAVSYQVFQEHEITTIKSWLHSSKPVWSVAPRTYIIFRTIDRLDLLDKALDSGFSDYQLPVAEKSFPRCLDAELYAIFKKAQQLVLSTVLELQRRGYGKHHHLGLDEDLPFDIKQRLGSGGFGQVDRVIHRVTKQEFALKRVPRKAVANGKGLRGMKGIISEIEILKDLDHEHIVKLVGSYTDHKFLGLLMNPVAEMDLSVFLLRAETNDHSMLRSFYGCLATGLQYLHGRQVRHKDIKPQNILVKNGTVLLADFGLARDFTDATGTTTAGKDNWTSPRYAAPEVMMQESRNTKSDIWSLGIVFLEMTVVLKGHNNQWLDEFLGTNGRCSKFIHSNIPGLQQLLSVLEAQALKLDNVALTWTGQMLREVHTDRPTAALLVDSIVSAQVDHADTTQFCGICCRYADEPSDDTSDDESEEDGR